MGILREELEGRMQRQNKNVLILFSGESGSGKSITSGTICHEVDSTFSFSTLRSRVAKSAQEFFAFSDGITKGMMMMWDDAGIGLSASKWWEIANILTDFVLQTFRHENIGVIFTAPSMKDMDSKARRKFQYYMEVEGIDYKNRVARVKVRRWEHNAETGKTYSKRLTQKHGNITLVLQYVEVPMMPDDVFNEYEAIIKPWKESIKENAQAQLAELTKDSTLTDQDIVKKIMDEGMKDITSKHGRREYIDHSLVEFKFGIGNKRAVRIVNALKRQMKEKKQLTK